MILNSFYRLLIGNPIESKHLENESLSKTRGLAVLASDALSSTAYATEEMLRVLVIWGSAAMAMALPASMGIVLLMLVLCLSYYRTIHAYSSGGGAYSVAKENLGMGAARVAAAALLLDYILTVAVSVSASVAAISSAFPSIIHHELLIASVLVLLGTVTNLRGVRESSTLFSIPAYLFVVVYGAMIVAGLYQILSGDLPSRPLPEIKGRVEELSSWLMVFVVLKAFSSGASALTGIEAISNGVQGFAEPKAKNATTVLALMIGFLAFFFFGTSFLADWLAIVPSNTETVVSQIARIIFGESWMYYGVQIMTMLILILAANTAYTSFPRLTSVLGRDRQLPRQLSTLGDRLVYSNGIVALSILSLVLIFLFKADVHALVPLYMVGVFITFTISQFGMVKYWIRTKSKNWRLHLTINGVGGTFTLVVGIVVLAVKFVDGAWITFVAIGIFYFIMRAISLHYEAFSRQLSVSELQSLRPYSAHKVVLPVSDINRGVLEAVRYAKSISLDVTALHVDLGDPERVEMMRREWQKWHPEVPLEILPSPYRSVITPVVTYLDELRDKCPNDVAFTVVVPELVPSRLWHHLLHNHTAFVLKLALLYNRSLHRRIKVIADVPYYLRV